MTGNKTKYHFRKQGQNRLLQNGKGRNEKKLINYVGDKERNMKEILYIRNGNQKKKISWRLYWKYMKALEQW